MKRRLIYTITNTVNGKVYVGQTRQGMARRKTEHIARLNLGERDHKLYQAMRKHGLDKFRFDVICNALDAAYLDELEAHFVREFHSFHRGYNMTCGGDAISDETRAKLSAASKGRAVPWHHKLWVTRRLNPAYRSAREWATVGADCPIAKRYLIRLPSGEEQIIVGINAFCKAHGLTKKCLFDVLAGKQRHHKGFSLLARFND